MTVTVFTPFTFGIWSPPQNIPKVEVVPLPLPIDGQTTYGFLKAAFERTMAGMCTPSGIQGVALRLEYPGFIDPAPMRRYITEDAYISRGIATPAAVVYGDRQIGPSGALQQLTGE